MPARPAPSRAQAKTRPSRPSGPGGQERQRRSERQIPLGRRTARMRRIDTFAVAAEVRESPFINELAARGIHYDHSTLHSGDLCLVDYSRGFVRQRNMQGNNIRQANQFVQRNESPRYATLR